MSTHERTTLTDICGRHIQNTRKSERQTETLHHTTEALEVPKKYLEAKEELDDNRGKAYYRLRLGACV